MVEGKSCNIWITSFCVSFISTYRSKSSLGPFLRAGFGPFALTPGESSWVQVPRVILENKSKDGKNEKRDGLTTFFLSGRDLRVYVVPNADVSFGRRPSLLAVLLAMMEVVVVSNVAHFLRLVLGRRMPRKAEIFHSFSDRLGRLSVDRKKKEKKSARTCTLPLYHY